MEHIKTTELAQGIYRLEAEEGYALLSRYTGSIIEESIITRDLTQWEAAKKEESDGKDSSQHDNVAPKVEGRGEGDAGNRTSKKSAKKG
jgi:hypothetical protein